MPLLICEERFVSEFDFNMNTYTLPAEMVRSITPLFYALAGASLHNFHVMTPTPKITTPESVYFNGRPLNYTYVLSFRSVISLHTMEHIKHVMTQKLVHQNFQEWPRQTKPKKGQFMNFSQGHSGTKVQCESRLFSQEKNTRIHKNGRNSWTFRFGLSLVWFAGATPETFSMHVLLLMGGGGTSNISGNLTWMVLLLGLKFSISWLHWFLPVKISEISEKRVGALPLLLLPLCLFHNFWRTFSQIYTRTRMWPLLSFCGARVAFSDKMRYITPARVPMFILRDAPTPDNWRLGKPNQELNIKEASQGMALLIVENLFNCQGPLPLRLELSGLKTFAEGPKQALSKLVKKRQIPPWSCRKRTKFPNGFWADTPRAALIFQCSSCWGSQSNTESEYLMPIVFLG